MFAGEIDPDISFYHRFEPSGGERDQQPVLPTNGPNNPLLMEIVALEKQLASVAIPACKMHTEGDVQVVPSMTPSGPTISALMGVKKVAESMEGLVNELRQSGRQLLRIDVNLPKNLKEILEDLFGTLKGQVLISSAMLETATNQLQLCRNILGGMCRYIRRRF